jgi:hypothetical protein
MGTAEIYTDVIKMQTCHDCQEEFETWVELAQHIVSQKKTHNRKSRVWALTFLAKKDNVQEHKPRSPMSEETRQIIKECKRELSGKMEMARTVCPNCKQVTEQSLEVEYLQDRSWRNSNGTLIVNCQGCRREK